MLRTCCTTILLSIAVACTATEDSTAPSPPWIEFLGQAKSVAIDLDQDGTSDTVALGSDGTVVVESRSLAGEVALGAVESTYHLTGIVDLNGNGIADLVVVAVSESGYVPQYVLNSRSGPVEIRLSDDFAAPEIAYGNVVVASDAEYTCDVLRLAQPEILRTEQGETRIRLAVNPPPPNTNVQDPCTGFPRVTARVGGDSLVIVTP